MVVYVEPTRLDFWQLAKEPDESYIDPMGPKNCGTHSASRMAMRAAEGIRPAAADSWKPTGYQIRRYCYNPDGTRDTAGGVHHGQTKAAVRMLYGVELTNYYAVDFDEGLERLEETRGGSFSLWYKPIRDYSARRGSFTFYQNHEIFISSVDRVRKVLKGVVDPLADGRQSGLYHGPGEYPISLIREACGELNVSGTSTYRALGAGKVYVQTTRATGAPPAPPAQYKVVILGKTPLYLQPFGTRSGGVSRATYICIRQLVGGIWWFRILNAHSDNYHKWFKANPNMETSRA